MSSGACALLIMIIAAPLICIGGLTLVCLIKRGWTLIRDPYGLREIEEILRKVEEKKSHSPMGYSPRRVIHTSRLPRKP